MFSIIIPTYNNLNYLKICINSILKNSKFKHQIVVHVNEGEDGTINYLKKKKISYTWTYKNVGLCKGVNLAVQKSKKKYIVYSHDDFYFCPNWDLIFYNEIKKIKHNNFYLSGIMIGSEEKVSKKFGNDYKSFNENFFLNNYLKIKLKDYQGSTWAPHIVHKDLWLKVGGFSEEFFPGAGSDPDLNMKLWNQKVRIFKGLANCRVYHFESRTLRRTRKSFGTYASKLFLFKWKISINFFKRYYLRSGSFNTDVLNEPNLSLMYIVDLIKCKIHYLFIFLFNREIKKKFENNEIKY